MFHRMFQQVDMFALFSPSWGSPGCCPGDHDERYEPTATDRAYGELLAERFFFKSTRGVPTANAEGHATI